jgi:SAM-dependent methyltransferase
MIHGADPKDPKQRFSNRVDDYVRYRPGYPASLAALLVREAGLLDLPSPERGALAGEAHIVDVGSGTGIMTRALLAALDAQSATGGAADWNIRGARVVGVEPNRAMREAAEAASAGDPRFVSLEGSAEATGLTDGFADLVVAAQAFHWFDAQKTRAEFARIGKERALVALVWNERRDSPLNRDYERMLEELAPDYAAVRAPQRENEAAIRAFFAPARAEARVERHTFDNEQRLDQAGMRGRLLSSSYCPAPGAPGHEEIMNRVDAVFRAHQKNGLVTLEYETVAWLGRLPRT